MPENYNINNPDTVSSEQKKTEAVTSIGKTN